MAKSTVAVRFTGDVDHLKRSIGEVDGKLKGLGGKVAGFGKTLALGFGAGAVGAGVLAKGFVDAAIESQKVTKQTEAVLKSMGGAAHLTAFSVGELANQLSLKSGVDDEVIQSAENVLLTFGKVRNEIGKGNAIFDRGTQAALDMSVALGTDMQGATIQIGKALNDPIKGITALSRAGVSFTQEQKDQIKTLTKSGKTLDAQKIILKELENQFGGSAEAQATAGDKLKVTWGNLQEQLGGKLLPVFEKVAGFLADKLPGAFDAVERAFSSPAFQQFADQVRQAFDQVAATVQEWWPKVTAAIGQVVGFVQQHWPEIQRIISQVMTTVSTIISGVVSVITTLWDNFGNNILSFVQRVWPAIQQVIKAAMNIIQGVIKVVTSLIKGDWANVWEGIKQIFRGVWGAIQAIVKAALEAIRLVIGAALEVIGSIFKSAWNGIIDFFKGVPGKLASAGAGMFDFIKDAFKGALNWVIRAWNRLEFKIPGFDPPGPGPKFGGFTLGVPNIPTLHSGGMYKAPAGQREGLALLRNDEGVFTPEQMAALGRREIVELHTHVYLDGRQVAESVRRHERSLR